MGKDYADQIAWTVLTTQVINSFTLRTKQMDAAGKLALQDLQQCVNTGCMPGWSCICIFISSNEFSGPGSAGGERDEYIPAAVWAAFLKQLGYSKIPHIPHLLDLTFLPSVTRKRRSIILFLCCHACKTKEVEDINFQVCHRKLLQFIANCVLFLNFLRQTSPFLWKVLAKISQSY